MPRLISIALVFLVSIAHAEFAKKPGATNAAVTGGDAAQFDCTPLDRKIFINEKGEVWRKSGKKPDRKPEKVSGPISDFQAGNYIEYLECFLVGDDVVAVFRQTNGEDGEITVRRKPLTSEKQTWHINITALNLDPPTLNGSLLRFKVDGARVDVNIDQGEVTATDSKGCLRVARWPKTARGVHRRIGWSCSDEKKPGK